MKFYEKQVRSGGFAAVKKLVQCVIKSVVAHGAFALSTAERLRSAYQLKTHR